MTSDKDTAQEDALAELQAAANMVLQRERQRKRRRARRQKRRARRREKGQFIAMQRMHQSIEVMKWCMVSITAIMFLGILIAIGTLSALHTELEKVNQEVEKFRPDVEQVVAEVKDVVQEMGQIREAVRNPMQSIGSAFGAELDQKLKNYLDLQTDR